MCAEIINPECSLGLSSSIINTIQLCTGCNKPRLYVCVMVSVLRVETGLLCQDTFRDKIAFFPLTEISLKPIFNEENVSF